MTLLVVVRHGRTEWNVSGRFQGWADPPLDQEGRRQAAHAAQAVVRLLSPSGSRVVVSSDLSRASLTAAPVARALGVGFSTHADLREVDVGRWQGLSSAEVADRYPEEYRGWLAGADIRRGTETLHDAGRRVAGRIAAGLGGWRDAGSLIVVGHGRSLQAGLSVLRSQGVLDFHGPPPHLGNGEYMAIPVRQTASL